jgi:hypothetical protein
MMNKQKMKITTYDGETLGEGEATKDGRDDYWHVLMPGGDFRFYGSISEVKAEIKKHNSTATCEVMT